MATEETEKGTDLILPGTGEVIPSDAATNVLGDAALRAREIKNDLDRFVQAVSDLVIARMDHELTWTVRLGGLKISAPAPGQVTYDAAKVRRLVQRLVREKKISRHAAAKALERKVEYKPKVAGLNNIAKISPEIKAAVEACKVPKDDRRRKINVEVDPASRQ